MLKFNKKVDQIKTIVLRLIELTGIEPFYKRTPDYYCEIGPYAIDSDGFLWVNERLADVEVVAKLMSEGLITGGMVVENEQSSAGGLDANNIDLDMNFTLPIGQHNGTTLRKLVNMIYIRGQLISKATGGCIGADKGLVDALKNDYCTFSRTNFLTVLSDYESQHGTALHGITITENEIIFTGFGPVLDIDQRTAYGHLVIMMNERALSPRKISCKKVEVVNEKYSMRTWLIEIGMGGAEYKKTRAVLLKNLDGNCAFRIPIQANKKTQYNAKYRI